VCVCCLNSCVAKTRGRCLPSFAHVSSPLLPDGQVQDLLAGGGKGGNLRVREHTILGPYVEGCVACCLCR
jgi:hypothetical protein